MLVVFWVEMTDLFQCCCLFLVEVTDLFQCCLILFEVTDLFQCCLFLAKVTDLFEFCLFLAKIYFSVVCFVTPSCPLSRLSQQIHSGPTHAYTTRQSECVSA